MPPDLRRPPASPTGGEVTSGRSGQNPPPPQLPGSPRSPASPPARAPRRHAVPRHGLSSSRCRPDPPARRAAELHGSLLARILPQGPPTPKLSRGTHPWRGATRLRESTRHPPTLPRRRPDAATQPRFLRRQSPPQTSTVQVSNPSTVPPRSQHMHGVLPQHSPATAALFFVQ